MKNRRGKIWAHNATMAAVFAATLAVAAPAIVYAALGDSTTLFSVNNAMLGQFTPATADPRLVAAYARVPHGDRDNFRFTPALGASAGENAAMTVVVRAGAGKSAMAATAITPSNALASAITIESPAATVKITPIAYNLGSAIGFNQFALPVTPGAKKLDIAALPKPKAPSNGTAKKRESRFGADMQLANDALPGTDPRLLNPDRAQSVDVTGKYKLTKNIDVTAGVRLRSETDRLKPLTDNRQDSQAVYVGTRFKF